MADNLLYSSLLNKLMRKIQTFFAAFAALEQV